MTRLDINGNTISKSATALRRKVHMAETYSTDSAGRIMVDDGSGGVIVFFAQDEPKLTAWVERTLTCNNPQPRKDQP